MASWTVQFSAKPQYSLTLTVSEKSYSVADNTSVVEYKLVMATAANSYMGFSNHRMTINCSINGTSVYSYNASRDFNPNAASSYSETLCSGTTTVTHNNDGTKTIACVASVSVPSSDYSPGSANINQSLALTTIPRASTASWDGNFVIGSAKTITITRASSSFTHKLTFVLGSKTVTPTSSAGTSYSWTPTSSDWAAQFPTQTSRTGTFTLYTYNGSTLIGSNAYTFTMQIPDSWKPTVSLTLSPYNTNTFLNSKSAYVAGYTAIRAAITGSAPSGTSIASYTIEGAFSKTVNTSSTSTTQTSGVITTSGSKTVKVTIKDARGRTGTASASCSFVSYSPPAVTQISYARGSYVNDTWTASDTGTDLRIVFSASVSLSNLENNLDWTIGAPVNASGSDLSGSTSITRYATGIGTTTAYSVVVTVTDDVGNSANRSIYVPTLEIPFVLDVQKPAIGVGAVPQTARTLEIASNWQIAPGGGVSMPYSNDVLTDALTVGAGACKAFRGSGGSYTGTLPSPTAAYSYGSFIVMRRNDNYIEVVAIPYSPSNSIAINGSNDGGSTWDGWTQTMNFKSVVKTGTISFSAGTIGTRGFQTSWNASSIGGTPRFAQITHVANSANYLPVAFLEGTTVYLNAYRCTASAVSNSTVDVTIYYN